MRPLVTGCVCVSLDESFRIVGLVKLDHFGHFVFMTSSHFGLPFLGTPKNNRVNNTVTHNIEELKDRISAETTNVTPQIRNF
ncbi:hypothetical protein TNCT_554111 [Trichonephila clavata]|uniref:Uncharacterized protein n=1 Tax=Trichonephila clavata TaxID=2740835 RepID=A0A8X6INZ5_TRICU|nr:hypothetical protein TNCT_554111 [Trichonephila clavata]